MIWKNLQKAKNDCDAASQSKLFSFPDFVVDNKIKVLDSENSSEIIS